MHIHQVYNCIGTEAAPVTLTAAFAGNAGSTILAHLFKKCGFDITYVPAENNAYAQLLFEYSNEDINSTSLTKWKPFAVTIPATTQAPIYAAGGDQMGTASGTPINFPAPNTSTAAVSYTAHVTPDTDLVANWIRVRTKEKVAVSFGTLFVGVDLQA